MQRAVMQSLLCRRRSEGCTGPLQLVLDHFFFVQSCFARVCEGLCQSHLSCPRNSYEATLLKGRT
jgi:hypothetical protein